jgi:hypothetical protein
VNSFLYIQKLNAAEKTEKFIKNWFWLSTFTTFSQLSIFQIYRKLCTESSKKAETTPILTASAPSFIIPSQCLAARQALRRHASVCASSHLDVRRHRPCWGAWPPRRRWHSGSTVLGAGPPRLTDAGGHRTTRPERYFNRSMELGNKMVSQL